MEKPKLGGDELTASFQKRLDQTIEEKFNGFKVENDRKYKDYIVSSDPTFVAFIAHFMLGNISTGKFPSKPICPTGVESQSP